MEMALYNLIYKTERALVDGLVTLGTFLDTEGAFDSTTFESMCKAAEEYGVEQNVVRWIHTMLRSQQKATDQMKVSAA
jgi:uncharacterized membrane protein YjjP (DUF1212 family)